MPEHPPVTTDNIPGMTPLPSDSPAEGTGKNGVPGTDVPGGMTLEGLVNLAGEMEHLNELVMLHVEKAGGFTCTAAYFTLVTPILDMLEVEIRFRYREGMTSDDLKSVIRDWINKEIAGIRPDRAGPAAKRGSE
ncbi:MAG: hypothetical protein WCX22_05655 [Methanoregula sp.]